MNSKFFPVFKDFPSLNQSGFQWLYFSDDNLYLFGSLNIISKIFDLQTYKELGTLPQCESCIIHGNYLYLCDTEKVLQFTLPKLELINTTQILNNQLLGHCFDTLVFLQNQTLYLCSDFIIPQSPQQPIFVGKGAFKMKNKIIVQVYSPFMHDSYDFDQKQINKTIDQCQQNNYSINEQNSLNNHNKQTNCDEHYFDILTQPQDFKLKQFEITKNAFLMIMEIRKEKGILILENKIHLLYKTEKICDNIDIQFDSAGNLLILNFNSMIQIWNLKNFQIFEKIDYLNQDSNIFNRFLPQVQVILQISKNQDQKQFLLYSIKKNQVIFKDWNFSQNFKDIYVQQNGRLIATQDFNGIIKIYKCKIRKSKSKQVCSEEQINHQIESKESFYTITQISQKINDQDALKYYIQSNRQFIKLEESVDSLQSPFFNNSENQIADIKQQSDQNTQEQAQFLNKDSQIEQLEYINSNLLQELLISGKQTKELIEQLAKSNEELEIQIEENKILRDSHNLMEQKLEQILNNIKNHNK